MEVSFSKLTDLLQVSILSALFISWLFISEFVYYMRVDVNPQLFVDTTRGEKLKINIDITFPHLSCACKY